MSNLSTTELIKEEKTKVSSQNQSLGDISKEMVISKTNNSILMNYAEELAKAFTQRSDLKERKSRGQFFTQKEIGLFMAALFDINESSFNVLDPGAGIGMLSAAFCERLLNSQKTFSVSLDAYETDQKLIPYLEKALKKCKTTLEEKGHKLNYKIIEKDFILNNPNHLNKKTLFGTESQPIYYDYIISNPPYYKLNKNSAYTQIMNEFVSGQPNIYSFFMALSLEMLKNDGQMVFITPRSFCSGLYFKRFRKWLIDHGDICNIHVFESRKDVFTKENVLQENVIIRLTPKKEGKEQEHALITKSRNSLFHDITELKIDYQDIFHRKNGDVFIKVPSSKVDIKVQSVINSWRYTLKNLGLKVSTGPVVSFRATKFLSPEFKDNKSMVPLLWMHNIKGMDAVWPIHNLKKEPAIKANEESKVLLVPTNNYVLVKRFSSKEQKKRVHAGVLLKSKMKFDRIGIENHLNYIYKYGDLLSVEETYGIAGVLNTSIIDIFFRMLNGSTQVNAVDIENLPLPSLEGIQALGRAIIKSKPAIGQELDKLVVDTLKIEPQILQDLKEVYKQNGKD
ncbi:MAG: Eco57I restriction-modification methylase domain-containing protein [Nanoarchaeota archaeon]|nr:Eco57I restriction-modification methylase domain-containing protein [Nanoarchaeota archaeon]